LSAVTTAAPPTIGEALFHALGRLAVVSQAPALDAEVLLAHVTGFGAAAIIAGARRLTKSQSAAFAGLVARRERGEPIAYLTGEREFWSLSFRVTSDVLIPRPDTETLVERALELIPGDAEQEILDLGTGSGNVAIAIALARPRCRVTAVDVESAALDIARDNAQRLRARGIEFVNSDWFTELGARRFGLIAGNPPYVAAGDPHLSRAEVAAEPMRALVSGRDGLDDITRIVAAAEPRLEPGGWLLLEHGAEQGEKVRALLRRHGFTAVATRRDLGGRERISEGRVGA